MVIALLQIIHAASIDCQNVINLAKGLGVQSNQPVIWSALQTDCCTATGVTCVSQRVKQIVWTADGLDGVINGTALPSSLTNLILFDNQISGSVELSYPSGLLELRLDTNQLSGAIPSVLPSGLKHLSLSKNKFNGTIPSVFPSGLATLSVWNNQLTGTIPLIFPIGLTSLSLDGNQLTGTIPANLPPGLWFFHVHDNLLTGDLPIFSSAITNIYLGYPGQPGNQFTGTLSLSKPARIYMNDNLVTDIIIQDSSALTICDLSNNPLLGKSKSFCFRHVYQNRPI